MRLQGRGQDDKQTIMKRMSDAENQMSHFDEFDYLVINDNFDEALSSLESIRGQSNKDFNHKDFSFDSQSLKHKNLLKKLI